MPDPTQLDRLVAALADRYVIQRELGSGGMASVYLAEDQKHRRKVAIKVLKAELAATLGPDRFLREIETAARLTHPHILPLYDSGDAGGVLYYVMPYVDGESLRERLSRERQLPLEDALGIACEVADGLGYAHSQGVVHRDVKPENVLLSAGHAVIADFGVACAVTAAGGERLTATGMIVGTPVYMSPEQASGEHDVDGRSDIYALGCLLFEMLAGEPPFGGPTLQAVLAQHLTQPPPPLRKIREEVPPAVEEALMRALTKAAADRYPTAIAFAVALRAASTDRPATALGAPQAAVGPAPSPAIHLPAPPSALVGREAELDAVTRLLRRADVRLVTLTGAGGVGKTRLALEVASRLAGEIEDGVHFVPLAEIRNEELLVSRIAQTLGVTERGGAPLLDKIIRRLYGGQLLLLLDNFEHLVPSAPLVTEILSEVPGLTVLVTSREVLRVRGEHEFRVEGLSVPPLDRTLPVTDLMQQGAVRLFVERAQAARSGFELTAANARAVAEICARLDGLPLAIELAAARTTLLTPDALVARLESRLQLLTHGARDLPERQRTMRDAIAWSYELLTQEERVLFRRLAVFAGGAEPEAVEQVCVPAMDVLDGISSLLDKSLVRSEAQADGEPRVGLLETLREYGLEQLVAGDEAQEVGRRHAEYFASFAAAIAPHLAEPAPAAWCDRLETEQPNLRVALEWFAHYDRAESGLALAVQLWRFWNLRSYFREGLGWLERLLALPESDAGESIRLKALHAAGVLADAVGDHEAEQRHFEHLLARNRSLGDQWGIANSLNNLGILALRRAHYERARALYEESLAIWRSVDNRPACALSLSNLGRVAQAQGDHAAAQALYREGAAIFRQLGDRRGMAVAANDLGDLARAQGEHAVARSRYVESLTLFKELGDRWHEASVLNDLGRLALDGGDPLSARQAFEQSLVVYGDLGDRRGVAGALEGFAAVGAMEGQAKRALRLAGAAEALRESLGAAASDAEQHALERRLAPVRAALGEKETARVGREGQNMSVEQAIAYATGAATG